jgi:glycosyltransferase involved in cell wall biosynthesis
MRRQIDTDCTSAVSRALPTPYHGAHMTGGQRPTIAFISTAQEYAGAEVYLISVLDGLRDRFEFVVVVSELAATETREKAERAGARVISVPGLRRRAGPGVARRLRRELRQLEPAVVHVNLSDQGDGLAVLAIARLLPMPVIATLHNVVPGRTRRREFLSKKMLRSAMQVIAVSERLARYLERAGAHGVLVKNGLLTPTLDPHARERLGLPEDAFVVGGIGRLHTQKGWDVLCRAAALVHESRPDIRFVVIGEGPERKALARQPSYEHVDFPGYVEDASSLLGAFDLVAIPSRYEGLGLVAIEAMLVGIPIVASGIEGLMEVVGDTGRIVRPGREDLLADRILDLASDGTRLQALSAAARDRASRMFSRDRMVSQTAAVYDTVLGRVGTQERAEDPSSERAVDRETR